MHRNFLLFGIFFNHSIPPSNVLQSREELLCIIYWQEGFPRVQGGDFSSYSKSSPWAFVSSLVTLICSHQAEALSF